MVVKPFRKAKNFVRNRRINQRLSNSAFYSQWPSALPIQVANKSTLVSREHRFIYFRVPKVANSTVVKNLYFGDTGKMVSDNRGIEYAGESHFLTVASLSEEERLDDFFKFSFVRNPYARFLSFYLQKVVNPGRDRFGKAIRAYKGYSSSQELCLADALDYFTEQPDKLYANAHVAPQVAMLQMPVDKLDFIGHLESFDADLAHVY